MPWQGSAPNEVPVRTDGVRTGSTVWTEAANAAVKIRSDHHDVHDEDVTDMLAECLKNDGGNKATADIPFNSNTITGIRAATASGEPARINEVQNGSSTWAGTGGGTADVITVSVTPALTAYTTGLLITFKASADNTGSATINVNSVGAKTIKKLGATNLAAGELKSGVAYDLLYDGTNFQLLGLSKNWATLDISQIFTQDQTISADETLLFLTRTANNTSAHRAIEVRRGSGAGTKGYVDVVGDASNGVAAIVLGAGTTDVLEVNQDYVKLSKQAYFPSFGLTDAASITWDMEAAQTAKVTLGGNRTLAAPSNLKEGAYYSLAVTQDATGSRTLSYNAVFKWPFGIAPVLSTGAADIDILVFYSNGTNLYGCIQSDFS